MIYVAAIECAGFIREIGFAGLVVEDINLRARIVGDNNIIQPIAINVRHVQGFDLRIDRIYFRTGETENICVRVGRTKEETGRNAAHNASNQVAR